MEIIKAYSSGKTKISHNGGTIFVKPFSDGDQNWASSWLVTDHQNELTATDAKSAFEIATGIKESAIFLDEKMSGTSLWVVRVK